MSLSFGTTVIYDDAEFNLSSWDKVGIIGVNGAGKTTLFRVLMNQICLDSGSINTSGKTLGYLPQVIEIMSPDLTVWDFLLSARPISDLESKLHQLYLQLANDNENPEILKQISDTQDCLERYDCYGAEDTLLDIITNIGIDSDVLDRPLHSLSGGQKSKVAFARLLYSMADILLLDEPTNHLDASTKEYITAYLKKYKGMVLIISHDKEFLNQVVNKILFIDKTTHKTSVFDGNYSAYQNKSIELGRAKAKRIDEEARQIKQLNSFIERARQASPTNHSIKKLGHTREIQLNKILANRTQRDLVYKKIKMDLTPTTAGARTPVRLDALWFRFPGAHLLYRNLSFTLTSGERFLIVGQNGVGKSTLLKLILGILTPERGTVEINPKTNIAYYAQELELLDTDKTIMENLIHPDYTDQQLRAILGNFLFYDTDVFKKLHVLSPGERARVALCKLLLKRANMLILDEPTNHLDPETQAIIGDNFRDYAGTIVVVSHNPTFVEQIGITRMLVLPSGRIEDYSHDLLEHYYQLNTKEINI